MKKLFVTCICLAQFILSIAQIKMASNADKRELSVCQKATEPLSVEASFSSYDGTFIYQYSTNNIVGDTLYTNGCQLDNCIKIDNEAKTIVNCSSLPKGYYQITGMFITQDNGSNELAEEIFGYVNKGYSISLKIGSNVISDKAQLCNAISRNGQWLGGSMNHNELKIILERNRLENKVLNFNGLKTVYRLENTETPTIYYNTIPAWIEDRFIPVSYFNFITQELKGKDVMMTYSGNKNEGTGFYRNAGAHRELIDVLTGQTILQKDTLFRCVDIVADAKDDGSGMKVCCVLEGKNTGKIALNVVRLIESKDEDRYDDPNLLNYYKSANGGWTIWQEAYNQKKEGMLIRGRHFDVAHPSGGNKIIGYAYRRIIKVDDLKRIFDDTKKHLANAVDRQKQVAAKYNAWETYRLYNLSQKYGEKYGSLILDHKIAVGMSPEMCKEAWGYPIKILTGKNEMGNYTEWIYNYNRYVCFVNNKVVEIFY